MCVYEDQHVCLCATVWGGKCRGQLNQYGTASGELPRVELVCI